MSKEIIDWLGPVPSEEDCAQTVDSDFHEKNRAECKRFKELIEKIVPTPKNAYVRIHVENGHDFGTYREVVLMVEECQSEENEKKIIEWTQKINALPNTWKELEEMVKV